MEIDKLRLLDDWVLVKLDANLPMLGNGLVLADSITESDKQRDKARTGTVLKIGESVLLVHVGAKVWFDKYGAMTELFSVPDVGWCRVMKEEDLFAIDEDENLRMRMLNGYVFMVTDDENEKTKSGIEIIKKNGDKGAARGVVLFRTVGEHGINPGDSVIFSKESDFQEIRHPIHGKCVAVKESDILAVV